MDEALFLQRSEETLSVSQCAKKVLAPVVEKLDSATHRININLYPVDKY